MISKSPILERRDYGVCRGCGFPFKDEDRKNYAFADVYSRRGRAFVSVYRCCSACQAVDAAIEEADEQQRRYTGICAGLNGNAYNGERCLCGCVKLVRLDACIQCSRAQRMLTKAQAESRLITKLLKELRAEVKEQHRKLQPVEG